MKNISTLLLIFFAFVTTLSAQMWNGVDTLYGNEWIQYEQSYYKIPIAENGIYRVFYQDMVAQGIPLNSVQGNRLQLIHMGQEIPIHVSNNGTMGNNDYIEFYGKKNRGNLDRYLYEDPDAEMANPEYSLFSDTSAYFLTWNDNVSTQRVVTLDNDLNATSTPAQYCLYTDSLLFQSTWTKDIHGADGVLYSRFEKGEGFVSEFKKNQNIKLQAEQIYAAGPESQLSLRYVTGRIFRGRNVGLGAHDQNILINGDLVVNDIINGIQTTQHNFNLSTAGLTSEVTVELQGNVNNSDQSGIAFAKLTYPRNLDFGNATSLHFKLPASNQNQLLTINNFNAEATNPILHDLTNQQRIVTNFDGTNINVVVPPSNQERAFVLVNEASAIKNVNTIQAMNFVDYSQQEGEFVIISNDRLFDDGQGNNWVSEYADYRSSTAGRGYNSVIVDVQQLYEQFSYGINRHSISIRNFTHFINKNWDNPQYVFLVGKGIEYQSVRSTANLNEALALNSFHVPTFGCYGGADNLFATSNAGLAPEISIGRLPAKTGVEVRAYLDKVIEHEEAQNKPQTIADKEWQKRVIHLGGGSTAEQTPIRFNLEGMKSIIENNKFGAEVTSFYKESADPIYNSQTEELKNLIDAGAAVLTFFGHSSPESFDYSIDNATAYNNRGKYPLMFSFGCYSGQIHSTNVGISEDFVLTPEKGAIAFFASTGIGYVARLNFYGREFYSQLGGESYGLGIGDISRITIRNTQSVIDFLGPQMTLNGDPAIRVYVGEGPDYVIDRSSVKFDPNPISIQKDSFDLSFNVSNIGNNIVDTIVVEVKQKFPNSEDRFTVLLDSIPTPSFRSTLNYRVPVFGRDALGPNQFFIEIDKRDKVVELPNPQAEENNTLQTNGLSEGLTVYFISKEIVPVFPQEFSIVDNPNLTLKASTSSTFVGNQKYVFQIDTTENFDSPFLQETEVAQIGGVARWKPTVSYLNNTVYYWRVSPEEDLDIGGFVWRNSSFLYLAGSGNGWNQSHKYQYEKDNITNIIIPESGDMRFISDFKAIKLENLAVDSIFTPSSAFLGFYVSNNVESRYFGSFANLGDTAAVQVVVFDSIQVEPKLAFNAVSNNFNKYFHSFKTGTVQQRAELIEFLNNGINEGEFVLFFTAQMQNTTYSPEAWASDVSSLGTSIFDLMEVEGANQIRNLETRGAVPYIFLYQKGKGALREMIASSIDDLLIMQHDLPGNWDSGSIESTKIGPARSWETFQFQTTALDNQPATDEFYFDLYGVDQNQKDSLLMTNIQIESTSLTSIDANEFPYLRLKFNSKDTVFRSSAHLDHWRVLYEGLPEIALNPASLFTFQSDTLEQGEPLELRVALENIGRYDMDSVLMKFAIIDQNNNQDTILRRLAPIIVGDTLVANLNLDTRNFGAKNTLFIEANPNEDQKEEFHFNNLGFFDFYVRQDERNPLLDVTFDGFHIMDGDLVSSKPKVLITLKDENKFLMLNDTSSFQIVLKSPGSSDLTPVPIDGERLTFYPATVGSDNKARMEFHPILEQDGTYELIVLAEDISGNESGDLAYKVTFEVTNKSSISKVLNYPNPFSTSTKFVFTVTGDEIPANMKIQIMTVSGRIVREIMQEELGPIHVGDNMTQYSWNGTDEFGAKLANGVYLYRVVAEKENGEAFEPFQSKADSFFKNGFGKMVILR